MKININIKRIGSDKNAVDKVLFYFDQIPSTVGELITIITEKCVNDHNERASKTEPEPMTEEYLRDMESVGRFTFGLDYNGNLQDRSDAIKNAFQCYEDGLFRIFLNDEELGSLSDSIKLCEDDDLTFIRLTMLSGRVW